MTNNEKLDAIEASLKRCNAHFNNPLAITPSQFEAMPVTIAKALTLIAELRSEEKWKPDSGASLKWVCNDHGDWPMARCKYCSEAARKNKLTMKE